MTHKRGHNPRGLRAGRARRRARRNANRAFSRQRQDIRGRSRAGGNIMGTTGGQRLTVRTTSGVFRIAPKTSFFVPGGASTPRSGSGSSFGGGRTPAAAIGQFDFRRRP